MIRVRVTTDTGVYPVGAELGFADLADAVRILGEGNFVQTYPQTAPTQEEIDEATASAIARAQARRIVRGEEVDALRTTSRRPGGVRAIALGDSITAGTYSNNMSWFTWAVHYSQGGLMHLANAGISGNTLAQMRDRLDADVLAHDPDIVFLLGGANDVGTLTAAQAGAIIDEIVTRIGEAGATPILLTLPPRLTGGTLTTTTATYNEWIRRYGLLNGVLVLDATTPVADVTTGYFATGMATDGLHPTMAGAHAMGKAVAAQLANLFPSRADAILPASNGNPANTLTNGLFLADANADGVADGVGLTGTTGTITTSLVPDAAIRGNWQRLAMTAGGNKSFNLILPDGSWSVGDTLRLTGRVKYTHTAGTDGAYLRFLLSGVLIYHELIRNAPHSFDAGIFDRRITIPVGTTSARFLMIVGSGASGSTATGTLDVAQFKVTNETRLGLA